MPWSGLRVTFGRSLLSATTADWSSIKCPGRSSTSSSFSAATAGRHSAPGGQVQAVPVARHIGLTDYYLEI